MNEDAALEALSAGDLRLHELEDKLDPATAQRVRRQYVESETGVDLHAFGEHSIDPSSVTANIENCIGAAQIPLGVAGPLPVDGSAADGAYWLPLATTEGALLASVNRGCSVINAAGGATTRVTKTGMTRAPVFKAGDVAGAAAVADWVEANRDRLRSVAEETTSHGELLDIEPYVVGDAIYCRFTFDPKDAMGMNMVTIATRAATALIEEETDASLVALSGNLCTDKKPAAINAIQGRGRSVTADVTIPADLVEERLGTTPASIAEVNERKNLIGSAKAGSLGFNAHAANTIAAMFLATGQDAAQVVEGANAITTVRVDDGDLYATLSCASLEVGTVGGGTGLATQATGLELLGLAGGGEPPGSNAAALAEVIAAGALAGELSLLAALASRHLTSAHESLGR